jgi:hypothetical protein
MSIDMTVSDVASANSGGSWGGGGYDIGSSSEHNSTSWPYDAAGHPMGTAGYSGVPDRDYSAKTVAEAHAEVAKIAEETIKESERSKTPAPITPERAAPFPEEHLSALERVSDAVDMFIAHHFHLHIHLPNPNPTPPTPSIPPVFPNTPPPIVPPPGKRDPW